MRSYSYSEKTVEAFNNGDFARGGAGAIPSKAAVLSERRNWVELASGNKRRAKASILTGKNGMRYAVKRFKPNYSFTTAGSVKLSDLVLALNSEKSARGLVKRLKDINVYGNLLGIVKSDAPTQNDMARATAEIRGFFKKCPDVAKRVVSEIIIGKQLFEGSKTGAPTHILQVAEGDGIDSGLSMKADTYVNKLVDAGKYKATLSLYSESKNAPKQVKLYIYANKI